MAVPAPPWIVQLNLVPITALLTGLVDSGKVSIEDMEQIAEQCRGVLHFRPSNRETYARVREIMGGLLDIRPADAEVPDPQPQSFQWWVDRINAEKTTHEPYTYPWPITDITDYEWRWSRGDEGVTLQWYDDATRDWTTTMVAPDEKTIIEHIAGRKAKKLP